MQMSVVFDMLCDADTKQFEASRDSLFQIDDAAPSALGGDG